MEMTQKFQPRQKGRRCKSGKGAAGRPQDRPAANTAGSMMCDRNREARPMGGLVLGALAVPV